VAKITFNEKILKTRKKRFDSDLRPIYNFVCQDCKGSWLCYVFVTALSDSGS
jgi:hypothetical protein